jgi:hypothetical protein
VILKNYFIRKFVIKESKSRTKGVKKKSMLSFSGFISQNLRAMKKKEEGGQGSRKC